MRYELEIKKLKELQAQTLKLISLHRRYAVPVPFSLKGNLGEFLTTIDLMRSFPEYEVNYKGGASREVDITLGDHSHKNKVKIQVKTQIKHPPGKYYDYESSPTIKRTIIEDKKCDIIVLQILYPSALFDSIKKANTYVFDQNDFMYFSPKGCWSGKSKGDYTIFNILKVYGNPPRETKDRINYYDTKVYHYLFKNAKDNWGKVERLIRA